MVYQNFCFSLLLRAAITLYSQALGSVTIICYRQLFILIIFSTNPFANKMSENQEELHRYFRAQNDHT